MSGIIDCSILTPEKTLYEGQVDFAVVQAHDGELGFMSGHAPLISKLGNGELRLKHKDSVEYMVIEGGLVEIKDNKLIVLAENAFKIEELDKAALEAELEEVKASSAGLGKFSEEKAELDLKKEKIKARLKVALR